MSDATAIVATIEGDGTMAGLIGGRIYPFVLPVDPTLPAITYQLVSQPTDRTQTGEAYRWPRWRFRIISGLYSDLEPIAAALAALFSSPGPSPFRSSWLDGTTESREPDTGRFWRLVDVLGFQIAGASQ